MKYDKGFFERRQDGADKSAREVVPLLIQLFQPKSIVDIGCGIGTWLSVFKEHGIDDFLGVDGDYVDRKMLLVPEGQFLSFDLKKPLNIHRKFDLVLSLEVAEHLPGECAEVFVDSLVHLGPAICFSAAIPFQGGTNHINEQWPDYWVKLFRERGYVVIDIIRRKIWENDNIGWCYAQNTLVFVEQDYLLSHPSLKNELGSNETSQLLMVHPKAYLNLHSILQPQNMPLRQLLTNILMSLAILPRTVVRALRRRIKFF